MGRRRRVPWLSRPWLKWSPDCTANRFLKYFLAHCKFKYVYVCNRIFKGYMMSCLMLMVLINWSSQRVNKAKLVIFLCTFCMSWGNFGELFGRIVPLMFQAWNLACSQEYISWERSYWAILGHHRFKFLRKENTGKITREFSKWLLLLVILYFWKDKICDGPMP